MIYYILFGRLGDCVYVWEKRRCWFKEYEGGDLKKKQT